MATDRPSPAARWDSPATVSGFASSPPNATLMAYAAAERARRGRPIPVALDLGCGAARNAAPLAAAGWHVVGVDLSQPMLDAALLRVRREGLTDRIGLVYAGADVLPLRAQAFDLVIAHGIWNLARSGAAFRQGVAEAARVARPGGGLFLFTFSRNTLAESARPVAGEEFVFTDFSGEPQCFLTEAQIVAELRRAGFRRDPDVALTEHNRASLGRPRLTGGPVVYEGTFRREP
jgi:SAM-dependent methyltransferase